MNFSRRELTALLPALMAANASAQEKPDHLLPMKVYHSDRIPYTGNQTKKGRRFFLGTTHTGFNLEMHESILGPGLQTHAPHKHEHVEIVIVAEGTLEANLDGKPEVAETGSVIYFASNQTHNARNVGSTPCRYIVLELRGSEA